jgi:RNA polymerase sigma-70 factor, ECF subfamily
VSTGAPTDDDWLLHSCRDGDEAAFVTLVRRHHPALVALARCWPGDAHEAHHEVRAAWMTLLSAAPPAERADAPAAVPGGATSVRARVARAAVPGGATSVRARVAREVTRAATRRTNVRLQAPDEPIVDPDRFFPRVHELWPDEWADPPRPWGQIAARRLSRADMPRLLVRRTRELGVARAAALTLRDVHGWSILECAAALDLPEPQMRSLLGAAREGLRAALEAEIDSR